MHVIELGPFVADHLPTLTVDGTPIHPTQLMFTYWSYAQGPSIYELSIIVTDGAWPTAASDEVEVHWAEETFPGRISLYRYAALTVSISWPRREPAADAAP